MGEKIIINDVKVFEKDYPLSEVLEQALKEMWVSFLHKYGAYDIRILYEYKKAPKIYDTMMFVLENPDDPESDRRIRKSSDRSGVETLMKEWEIQPCDVEEYSLTYQELRWRHKHNRFGRVGVLYFGDNVPLPGKENWQLLTHVTDLDGKRRNGNWVVISIRTGLRTRYEEMGFELCSKYFPDATFKETHIGMTAQFEKLLNFAKPW